MRRPQRGIGTYTVIDMYCRQINIVSGTQRRCAVKQDTRIKAARVGDRYALARCDVARQESIKLSCDHINRAGLP